MKFNKKIAGNGPTEDAYIVFSEKSKQVIDLSFLFKGEINVVDGLNGSAKKLMQVILRLERPLYCA